MVCSAIPYAIFLHPLAVFPGNAKIRVDDLQRRNSAQANNDLRLDQLDLAPKKTDAGLLLVFQRISVFGRAAFYNVGNINIASIQINDGKHIIQKLTGRANEGDSLEIFLLSRAFTNKENVSIFVANSENNMISRGTQAAAVALQTILFEL